MLHFSFRYSFESLKEFIFLYLQNVINLCTWLKSIIENSKDSLESWFLGLSCGSTDLSFMGPSNAILFRNSIWYLDFSQKPTSWRERERERKGEYRGRV